MLERVLQTTRLQANNTTQTQLIFSLPTDLIESKGNGIFSLLDEESKLPQCSSTHFTTEVHRTWNNHFRLALPRNSRLKAHREIRDDEGFLVRHFAGAVCYQTVSWNYKNKLSLHFELFSVLQ